MLRWSFNRTQLKSLRRMKGLSPEQFGKRIGRTGWSIVNWERGRTAPTVVDLAKIANEFDVDPGSFMTRDQVAI